MHATCVHDVYSSSTAYIVVLAESVTGDYFTSLVGTEDLGNEDPPAVCVAPSTGRFEVNGSPTSPPDLGVCGLFLVRPMYNTHRVSG